MDLFNPELSQNFWTAAVPKMAWEEVEEACDFGGHDPDRDSRQGGPIDAMLLHVLSPEQALDVHERLQAYRQARGRSTGALAASLFWCQLTMHPEALEAGLKRLPKGWALEAGYRGPLAHLAHRLPRVWSDLEYKTIGLLLKGPAGRIWGAHESLPGVPDWIWARLWLSALPAGKQPQLAKRLTSWEASSTPDDRRDWIRRIVHHLTEEQAASQVGYAVADISSGFETPTLKAWTQLAASPTWQWACAQEAAHPLADCLRRWRRERHWSGTVQNHADVAQLLRALFPEGDSSPEAWLWRLKALPFPFPQQAVATPTNLEVDWIQAIQRCPVPVRSVLDVEEVARLEILPQLAPVWLSRLREEHLAALPSERSAGRRWRS